MYICICRYQSPNYQLSPTLRNLEAKRCKAELGAVESSSSQAKLVGKNVCSLSWLVYQWLESISIIYFYDL